MGDAEYTEGGYPSADLRRQEAASRMDAHARQSPVGSCRIGHWRQESKGFTLPVPRINPGRAPGLALCLARYARPRSFRMRCAASFPGAPITQPPGWVPEPHW